VRTIRYREIADDLRRRLRDGEFVAGRVLPSEAALGERYDASRVTVRRALEQLRQEGLLDSRQGFGWFAAAEPIPQPLAGLATIEAQLAGSGRRSDRRILAFGFVPAPPHLRTALGGTVLEVRRLSLADDTPFARVTVWCREDLGSELSRADVERASFYELLPTRLGGATQTIGAAIASPDDAVLLRIPPHSAVLVVERTTVDEAGRPVLASEHVFPGHLTEFVVDLPRVDDALSPGGLRLVDPDDGPGPRGAPEPEARPPGRRAEPGQRLTNGPSGSAPRPGCGPPA
jgi:GntR family transcriptional regulator